MLRITLFAWLFAVALAAHEPFSVIFQWNEIDYVWPSDEARERALKRGEYVVENNPIAGIKFWKEKMYLTIPRWKPGVPATLCVTSATPQKGMTAPKLEPYPDWGMQTIGDCSAFQFVQSMEVDPAGRMWVLDTGRTETMTLQPMARCPPRLVILDLENNGAVLRSYNFPEHVASPSNAYLNDIVLDHDDGGMAYITDNGVEDPGIIVFSLQNGTSWKVRHESMKAQSEAVSFVVDSVRVNTPVHVDGIALSPPGPNRQVYYNPLSSFHLYSVPVAVLKDKDFGPIQSQVKELGKRTSQTDGMAMSMKGVLYFGLLADDAVAMWDTKQNPSFTTGKRIISRDHSLMQWPDTFAFDERGYLWCVTNALQNFMASRVDLSKPNYRIVRSFANDTNYQYLENGSVPELPVITAGADRLGFALSSCLAIVLVFLMH